MTDTQLDPAAIDAAWQDLQIDAQGHLMPSTAAEQIGVSEAALYCSRVGQSTTRLRPDFSDLLKALDALGTVKAVTRNNSVVHERHGRYSKVVMEPPMHGMVLDKGIDLRIILPSWKHALAVTAPRGKATSRSIQFFDAAGNAVHKVFCLSEDQSEAYEALVVAFADATQSNQFIPEVMQERPKREPAPFDAKQFEADWRAMTDPHQFFGLLGKYGLSKQAANRQVPNDLARAVAPTAIRAVLEQAAQREVPLMIFVGNRGTIQIHTGLIHKVVDARGWLNVLDAEFDLHVKEEDITEAWVVTKPAEGGRTVSSIECFDAEGTTLLSIFGERKPGKDELESWRKILASLDAVEVNA
jgi:putative hemin transport protein